MDIPVVKTNDMKTIYLYILIGTWMLTSCHHPSTSPLSAELAQVEHIMNEHPDSALHILQGMTPPVDELNHATWALFTTQAKYKLFMTQSDSLLNIAFPYFMDKGDAQRRAMVLYYRAALYREENKVEEAQEYYLKAKDEVENTENYELAHLIYIGLGNIYAYRSLLDYSLEAYLQAKEYALKKQEYKWIVSSYISVARIYGKTSNFEEAINYYKKAIEISTEQKDYLKKAVATGELASIYRYKKDYLSALSCIHDVFDIEKKHSVRTGVQKYLTLSRIYEKMNLPDSSIVYLHKATASTNIHTLKGVYTDLYNLLNKQGLYKEAAESLKQAWTLNDSIQQIDKSQALIEMQEKYNQQQVINAKNEMEIRKNQIILKVLVCLIIAIITIATLIYTYQKKLLEKERLIKQANQTIHDKSLQITENENTIRRNEARIITLSEEIGKNKGQQDTLKEQRETLDKIKNHNILLEQENTVLKQDINTIQQNLEQKSREIKRLKLLSEENLNLRNRERFLSELLIQKSKLLNNLINKPQYIEIEEWTNIIREVDYLFDDYTLRLSKLIPSLTESDIQICCLIKLHISNPTIATLLAISSSSVTKRKVRLKERIVQTIGTLGDTQSLEIWLWEF